MLTKELAAPSVSLMSKAQWGEVTSLRQELAKEEGSWWNVPFHFPAVEGVFLTLPTIRLSGGAGRVTLDSRETTKF